MFRSLKLRYKEWDQELLEVLVRPGYVTEIPPGFRRRLAERITELSEIERLQLREFSMKYRGRTFWSAVAKLSFVFTLLGLALLYLKPNANPIFLIGFANFLGWMVMFSLLGVWFNYRRHHGNRFRTLIKGFVGLGAGMVTGALSVRILFGRDGLDRLLEITPKILFVAFIFAGIYVLIIGIVASWRNQAFEAKAAQLALEAEKAKHAQQQSEAELRLLRAQIEPHFLFNTLGAVQQLAEGSAPDAARLTKNLIAFLRASTQMIRAEAVTLEQECNMIRAYLEVMKVRMGARLQTQIELPAGLAQASVPSMMLLTLVENAIKHGIEPSVQGGTINISAHLTDAEMLIGVKDSGVGLSDQPGQGVGLTNVRQRLRLMFGDDASLALYEPIDGGALAEVRVPISALRYIV